MTAPRRPRKPQPPARSAAPVLPLGSIIHEHARWRSALPGKPTRGTLRDHWQKLDAQHGQRLDYQLWRELHGGESPPPRKQDPLDLAIRGLKSPEAVIHWAVLSLLPDVMQSPALAAASKKESLLQALGQRLGAGRHRLAPLPSAIQSSSLLLWMARGFLNPGDAHLWEELASLLKSAQPEWKLGRRPDMSFWETEHSWPLTPGQFSRRLGLAIHTLVQHQSSRDVMPARELAPWQLAAWLLIRDTRTAQIPARIVELDVLLGAATASRLAGDADQAARLTALSLHLLPASLPVAMQQRCRVAAWTLAEAGLLVPPAYRTIFDELPFPGEPPASEAGQAAARQYLDPTDAAHVRLMKEVETDADWGVLRNSGVVLHHPLAALSWVARKAQSYALKKQHELLQSAATLATRHHRLTTLGRLLPHLPATPERVLDYAQTLRQSQRRMPFLRDPDIWADWTRSLRAAWARLEPAAIQDPEQLFLLHETLHDREVTLLRVLPPDLRVLALKNLHSRKLPSPLVQALVTDPRHMQQLEHQRQVELWSVAAELREKSELSGHVWLSLVMRGEAVQGRCSVIVQGPAGRVIHHEKLRAPGPSSTAEELDWKPLIEFIALAVAEVNPECTRLLVALDSTLATQSWVESLKAAGIHVPISFIPSWEWAFRVLRETPSPLPPGTYFQADSGASSLAPPGQPLPEGNCVLLSSEASCDAATRWVALTANVEEQGSTSAPASVRSLHVGSYSQVISSLPVKRGVLKEDLIRLSLAQTTRHFTAPPKALAETERASFLTAPLAEAEDWIQYGL